MNENSSSIRRIRADVMELRKHPSTSYVAVPQDDDLFRWDFTLRGPDGTPYEGGIYHGRLLLPSDYPLAPPSILLLTPNGRWQTNTKICLNISAHHPDTWQPAWSVRTILEALVSCLADQTTSKDLDGSLGAMSCSDEVRKQLAKKSRSYVHEDMPKLDIEVVAETKRKKKKDKVDSSLEVIALFLMMSIFAVLYRKTLLLYL